MEEDKEDSPEAPATSDPAAITKEDYETYLMRENGHFYTQAKADGQFSHLTEVYILQVVQFFFSGPIFNRYHFPALSYKWEILTQTYYVIIFIAFLSYNY